MVIDVIKITIMDKDKIKKIIESKVIGKIEPRHTDKGHFYYFTETGHLVPSVTTKIGSTISKNHLMAWGIKMGAEWLLADNSRLNKIATERFRDDMIKGMQLAHLDIRDTAGGVGSVAHLAAERFLNEWLASGIIPEKSIVEFAPENCDPRSIAAMRAIEAWFRKEEITPLASELLVGIHKFSAGTLDLLYLDKQGNLCLGDFKTSNAIDQDGYSMQVAAYKYFWESMTGIKIKHCKILLVSKDYDKFTVYKINKLLQAWKAFRNLCALHDWKYDNKDKIIKDIKRISI